jgi:hypothetical protein
VFLIRRSGETAGIAPEAIAALAAQRPRPTHETVHRLRQPLGIYNTSILRILPAFREVLNATAAISANSPFVPAVLGGKALAFLSAYERLLYLLMEHLDDCLNVLLCCFPSKAAYGSSSVVTGYKGHQRGYYRHLGRIVNKMKHHQARVRLIVLHDKRITLPGYYVEGVDEAGRIGPDKEIHKGGGTAFSAARDLRFHVANLYIVSHHLSQSVDELLGEGIDQEYDAHSAEDDIALMVDRIASLPLVLFPDELLDPFPTVRLRKHPGGTRELSVRFPDPAAELVLPIGLSRYVAFQGDGVSRAFAIPYGGDSDLNWFRKIYGIDPFSLRVRPV